MVLDGVRMFNKRVLTPVMRRFAGQKRWYAGVIEHPGRRSGESHTTPVVIERVTDGFIIPLPYGRTADWVGNVLASGGASLRVHGETYQAVEPEIIDAATAFRQLSPRRQREFGRFQIRDYLKMYRASGAPVPD